MASPIAGVVCGRKLCTSRYHKGSRWCHAVDFYVRTWWDEPTCLNPRTLTSSCRSCNVIGARVLRGTVPRRSYDFWYQKSHTAAYRDHERLCKFEARMKWLRDPRNRESEREYKRIYDNAKRAEVRRLKEDLNLELVEAVMSI